MDILWVDSMYVFKDLLFPHHNFIPGSLEMALKQRLDVDFDQMYR